ncbi:MAG: DNA cytosine methyltransferase, partial [Calditrichaeota bacterium]
DHDSGETFKLNFPNTHFELIDIENYPTKKLKPIIESCSNHPILFSGCAPCQPFTRQNTKRRKDDRRIVLLNEFSRFVEYYLPEFVFIENVPGMQKIQTDEGPFGELLEMLNKWNYNVKYDIVASMKYGVPQKRRRLVLIASRLGPINFPPETHGSNAPNLHNYATVKDYIGDLPPIEAGESHPEIPNHVAANLSALNLERIRATPEGGSREDWPEHLWLDCHKGKYNGHTDVYGRMRWNEPATGLTTRCISLSNGRFGHPEQNRAISVREAACLQTFPRDFIFYGSLNSMARQIGNAVPVLLAECFGRGFIDHLRSYL